MRDSTSSINLCNFNEKKEFRAYDTKINFTKKAFSQKFVDYIGPTYFNSMPFDLKKKMYIAELEILKILLMNGYLCPKNNLFTFKLSL